MNYISVTTKSELDNLLANLSKNESFIKEAHFESYSYLVEDAIVAPDSLGDFHLVILGEDESFFGAHLHFERVSSFNISLNYDFNPDGRFNGSILEFSTYKGEGLIEAKGLKYFLFTEPFLGNTRFLVNYLSAKNQDSV